MLHPLEPLVDVPVEPHIARLPKADLHVHQEERPRLERVLARRQGRAPYDWRASAHHLMADVAPGMARLDAMAVPDITLPAGTLETPEETIIAKLVDVLEEAAGDGAILVEVRVGPGGQAFWRPDFMGLFREAERRTQLLYPRLRAEALGFLGIDAVSEHRAMAERQFRACLAHAPQGLAGIDIVVSPYATEADPALWALAHRWSALAANLGLGITVHAAEFSSANLEAALMLPGLRRLGHAVHATSPRWLEQIARNNLTIECCLSCNVVLGAVASYEEHPIHQFAAYGIPVTLNTDDPVRIWTTIGREYAIASLLGISEGNLLQFTRNAIRASFTTPARRDALLAEIDE